MKRRKDNLIKNAHWRFWWPRKKFFNVGLNVFLLLSLDEKRFQQQNEDSSVLLFAENNYDFMALLWRA